MKRKARPVTFEQGDTVRLVDPVHMVARIMRAYEGKLLGAGGTTLIRAEMDGPAEVWSVGEAKTGWLLIAWGHGARGIWVDPADVERVGALGL